MKIREHVWSSTDTWGHIGLVLLLIATFAQTAFVLIYGFRRTWWNTRPGRAILVKSGSLAILLWLSLLNTFVIYPHQREIGVVFFGVITFGIIYQLVALVREPPFQRLPDPPQASQKVDL